MSAPIASIEPAADAAWDRVWSACDHATFFHSRAWAEIWSAAGASRPAAERIAFADGREALLPLSLRGGRLGRTALSSPAGTYGGWLTLDPLTDEHVDALVQRLLDLGSVDWRINPFDAAQVARSASLAEPDETHVLDLRDGLEPIWQRWSAGKAAVRRKVDKARRSGLGVRAAETLEDWRRYHAIYEASLERWGDAATSRYPWELFDAIHARRDAGATLWLVEREAEPIAGALCFYAPRHAVYWHGAALAEHFGLRPVNLLMADIAADACKRGCDWLDLNPSGGHDGVRSFKRSLGAEPRTAGIVRRESRTRRLARSIRRLARPVGS